MRRATYLFATFLAGAVLAVSGPQALAATPRTPDRPRRPNSSLNDVERRPAVRGGVMSLGGLSQPPTTRAVSRRDRRTEEVRSASSQVRERGVSYDATWRPPAKRTSSKSHAVARRIAAAWPGDDRDALNVATCESSMNPSATSGSGRYSGLFQFDARTWRAVGGTGSPAHASVEEQTKRAWRLKAQRGWEPWPVCGRQRA